MAHNLLYTFRPQVRYEVTLALVNLSVSRLRCTFCAAVIQNHTSNFRNQPAREPLFGLLIYSVALEDRIEYNRQPLCLVVG
jgi:hypothetical protein